jgi:hypothetical protein
VSENDEPTNRTRTAAIPEITRAGKSLIGVVAAGALVIAGLGFAGSYTAVAALATAKGFGWYAHGFPVGVDAGIVVFLALDLLLTGMRMPFPLLRPAAWGLTAATIGFNASVAWGDWLAVGMHAVTPTLFVVVVEAARHAVGRIAMIEADRHIESPPAVRWVLAPIPTYRIWRRMRLWHLRSYSDVIEQQKQLKVYRATLRADYGRRWRRGAPAEKLLVFELTRFGTSVSDALAAPEAEAEAHRRAEAERHAEARRQAAVEAEAAREAEAKDRAEAEARRIREAEAEAVIANIDRARRIAEAEAEAAIAAVEAGRRRAYQEQQAAEAEAHLGREREALRLAREREQSEAEALRAAQQRARLEAEAVKPKPKREPEAARDPKPKSAAKPKPAELGGRRAQVEAEVGAVLSLMAAEGYDAVGLERVKADFGLKHAAAYDRLLKARGRYQAAGRSATGTDS